MAILYYLVPIFMAVDYMAKRGPCQKKLECIVMGGCMFWSFSLSSDNQGWCVFTFFSLSSKRSWCHLYRLFLCFWKFWKSKQLKTHQNYQNQTFGCRCDEIDFWNCDIILSCSYQLHVIVLTRQVKFLLKLAWSNSYVLFSQWDLYVIWRINC